MKHYSGANDDPSKLDVSYTNEAYDAHGTNGEYRWPRTWRPRYAPPKNRAKSKVSSKQQERPTR